MSPEEYSECIGYALKPTKDSTGRFSAWEEVVIGPDGWSAATSCVGDAFAKDIAARLNGPSPAEVAALLRSLQTSGSDPSATSHGYGYCPACGAYRTEPCPDDCKLDAMIKQCEGA